MAFFARISDPAIGGTNMTFLNTLANLGMMWPNSFLTWSVFCSFIKLLLPDLPNPSFLPRLVDFLTWKTCSPEEPEVIAAPLSVPQLNANYTLIGANFCYGAEEVDSCKVLGGSCHTITDGYFSLR